MNREFKVLSIGNSFSQDAQRYLHEIAKADGTQLKSVNLYIGGCPLHKHFININNDSSAYEMEFDGKSTGFYVSVKEALQSDMWDVVTLQQVSRLSPDYSTFQPYLNALVEFIDFHSPKSEIMLHQTWAYEENSDRLRKTMGYQTSDEMFSDVKKSYFEAANDIGGSRIIPSGEVMLELSKSVISKVHRDTFHATLGLGRYALGITWYEMLTGNLPLGNGFNDFDEDVNSEDVIKTQEIAHGIVEKYLDLV